MSQAQLAAGPDRLPWLNDEPRPRARRGSNPALVAGLLVVLAAASLWFGARSWTERPLETGTTVTLPPARIPQPLAQQPELQLVPQPQVRPAPAPEVRPAPVRDVRIAPPSPVKAEAHVAPTDEPGAEAQSEAAPAPVIKAPAPAAALTPWPPRVTAGAAGRLAQVGAFGSRLQAKQGWWAMVRSYPAMAHLPAVVVEVRNSKGRPFYRFQIGTTSQAHSEVLCQRMEKIRFSCAVIGLPWKPNGVER
jgi:hypothetical protein